MTQVKICGLRTVEAALVAADAGANLLGFVFAPSRRQVEAADAREIIRRVRERSTVPAVGVFVNAGPATMNRVAHDCGLDYVQLSGDEEDDVVEALDVPAIQVFHVGADGAPEGLMERIEHTPAALVMLDTGGSGAYGGTGQTFDWGLVPAVDRPLLLAGGLHTGNVDVAIRMARPWGVDVSSGVERDGDKDPAKIRQFIARVRATPE